MKYETKLIVTVALVNAVSISVAMAIGFLAGSIYK